MKKYNNSINLSEFNPLFGIYFLRKFKSELINRELK